PITASARLRKSNPLTLPRPSCVPTQPPIAAPTIPTTIVTRHPFGSLPGVSHFAINPANSPITIHDSAPIRNLLYLPSDLTHSIRQHLLLQHILTYSRPSSCPPQTP